MGPTKFHADGNAVPVGQQGSLGPGFRTIRGVIAGLLLAERRLGRCSVKCLPGPIDPLTLVVLLQNALPQVLKNSQLPPLLEVIVDGTGRSELGWQCLPLAAGAEHGKNTIHHLPKCQSGATSQFADCTFGHKTVYAA